MAQTQKRNTFNVDEELTTGFNRRHFKRMMDYVKMYKGYIIKTLILMLIWTVLSLTIPLIISQIIDTFIPEGNVYAIIVSGGIMLGIWLTIALCHRARMHYMNQAGQGIIHKIRSDTFNNIQKLSFDYFDSRPHGKILIRVVNYVNSLSEMVSNGVVDLITNLATVIFTIIFMFVLNWRMALIAVAGLPILILFVAILKPMQRRSWRAFWDKTSGLSAYVHESIAGMRVTQSFAREEENLEVFKDVTYETKKTWWRAVNIQHLLQPIIAVISILTINAIFLAAVFLFADGPNAVTIGVISAFLMYINHFWWPITNIGNFYNVIVNNAAFLERIFETMDEEPSIEDSPNAVEMPTIRGDVEFKNVEFGYEKEQTILENLSFDVKAGENVALVGQTGGGKTTITALISRFYDVREGEVLIDGINIKDVKLNSLRRQMGVMMQDSFVFSGNIMDNIRYGNFEATDEEVINAAKAVQADDFISALPDGYYTEVTERGSTLSAGQRQLISFARALLANPKILILDEATSSIDTRTEMALQRGLEQLLKGRTSFVIAHRLSTIKNANRIMVIGNRGIVESGTHGELIKQKGAYYDLYRAQYDFLK